MKVSVLIPSYNEPEVRIRNTVDSVLCSALDAGLLGEIDVVIVDDGSSSAVTALHSPFVRIFRQEHKGIAPALHRALSEAWGQWVCWLSVGDTWRDQKLFEQLQHHRETGSLASFHDYYSPAPSGPMERPGDVIAADFAPTWESRCFVDNCWCSCTTMVDRDALRAIGGVMPAGICGDFPRNCEGDYLRYAVDFDFHQRVQLELGWTYIPQILAEASEFPGGFSDRARNNAELWQIKSACTCRVKTLGLERQRQWVDKRNRLRSA